MELEAFRENLHQLLMAHKLEELFKEVDENLAKRSDLQTFYGILRARHSRLKIGLGQGTEEKSAADLIKLVSDGTLKISIGQRYHLSEAAKAHKDLEARKTTGSTIFTL